MKKNIFTWAFFAMLGVGFTACSYEPIPEDSLIADAENAWQPTMSIADFKQTFDVKDDLYTINYIDTESEVIIKGRITSTDVAGNIYKYIMLQDETGEALKVSVDAGSLYGTLPLGQEIAIKCKGLVLGRYADMVQLGVETYNTNYNRIEPGRIPFPYFNERVQRIGYPDTTKVLVEEITIPQLLNADSTMHGRLVILKNVHFTGLGDDGGKLRDSEKIFAPSTFNGTYNVGYPQARQIADEDGNVAYVSTSEYARFAELKIPDSGEWGDIVALVGWYKNKTDQDGEFQLTIRTLNDLQGFTTGGDTKEPIFSETFLTGSLGGFTTYNVLGDQVWTADTKYGAKMSGYANGASNANEDWLISPAIDLTGVESAKISFEHAINKGKLENLKTNHTLWISDNYTNGDPAATTWEQLNITIYPDGTSWSYVSSGAIAIPAKYFKADVRIALKYLCSDTESATWELKNFAIK